MPTSRRTFLSAAAAIAAYLEGAPLANLSAEQAAVLDALCEQMLPSDDLPGAREANVVRYIDRQLGTEHKRYVEDYRSGLNALRAAGFLERSFEARTTLLERAEAGKVASVPPAFVRMVSDHTMQGFFGDPKHGGNQDSVSWKMLGIGGHSH